MKVIGNTQFITEMKILGLVDGHIVKTREDIRSSLENVGSMQIILINAFVAEIYPEIKEYANVVTIPDTISDYANISDLKDIIRSAIGIDLTVTDVK